MHDVLSQDYHGFICMMHCHKITMDLHAWCIVTRLPWIYMHDVLSQDYHGFICMMYCHKITMDLYA